MADITIHVDSYQDESQRQRLLDRLNTQQGVSAVTSQQSHPQLVVVEYDPDQVNSQALLGTVQAEGLHGELIGL